MRRPALHLLLLAVLAALPAPAHAGFFAGDAIDGPSPDIRSLGDLDLARDGTGALAYVKRADGADRVFVARFEGGVFQPAERLDAALATASSQPVVGAADRGRLVVVFASGGVVYGVVKPEGGAWSAPTPLGAGSDPSVDLSINGTAYASFTSAGDVRVARLDRRTNGWGVLERAADVDPARQAGVAGGRSRVAISADGVGVVTWAEAGHVFARKMFGGGLSTAPQDLTPASFDNRVATTSDLPDIDAEDDSSYAWVVFRQRFADGGSRILARRQRGTGFDPPVAVDDPAGEPVNAPRIDLNGRGVAVAVTTGADSGQPMAAITDRDLFGAGGRLLGPSAAPAVVPAVAENSDGLIGAVVGAAGEAPYVRVRAIEDRRLGAESVLSRPELGPVVSQLGFDVAADRASGAVVAWVQGGAEDRRIVAGYLDRPPGFFAGYTSQRCCQGRLPVLSWQPAFNLWGPLRYVVTVDGKPVGETTDTRLQLTVPLVGARHRWQVHAFDARGQSRRTRTRTLRIDPRAPVLAVRYRRTRRVVTLSVRARDPGVARRSAAGLRSIAVSWGDGTRSATGASRLRVSHRYRRGRSYRLQITATDRAGNASTSARAVRIG